MTNQIQIVNDKIIGKLLKNTISKYRVIIGLIIALIPVIYSVLPLFDLSFIPTHDGEYHIIRFYEFEKNLRSGILFPRWAEGLNSGYGIPLFIFMYPLPNYVGVLIHSFGFSYPNSFEISLGVFYITAIIFCYFWLLNFSKKIIPTIIGTLLMSLVPYWFLDIYIRGSIGEVMSLAFVFISLFLIEKQLLISLSFALAGLILSHNINAMIFIPILFLYSKYRNIPITPFIFGVLLSTFFWLPAVMERQYVTGLNTVNFRHHFPEPYELLIPSWGSGFSSLYDSNKMSFQIGVVPLLLVLISIIVYVRKYKYENSQIHTFFLTIFGIALIIMLPYSKFLWELIPLLQYIQYPWRLLSITIPFVGVCGAVLFSKSLKFIVIGIVFCIVSFLLVNPYIRPVQYSPRNDSYYLSRKEFTDGTSSMGNTFSTIWTTWKSTRLHTTLEFVTGEGYFHDVAHDVTFHQWKINAKNDSKVRAHTVYYPGWKAFINNQEIAIDYKTNGTIDVQIPKGVNMLTMQFMNTPIQKFATFISIFSLSILLVRSILRSTI